MGVKEFEAMFDSIDHDRKGSVSLEQIQMFCEALYYKPLCIEHVEGAAKLVCGSTKYVTRGDFIDVLTDIERRRSTEEQAYWDFQGLDYMGSGRVSVRDALLLFKETHGERFSLATWKRFLSDRESKWSDVWFDEIRFWLCAPPGGSPCSDKELKEEENRVLMQQDDASYDDYNGLKNELDDENSVQAQREEYEEDMQRHSDRKLKKWNVLGVEAMLFDDGLDVDEGQVKVTSKSEITMGDLMEILETKYNKLRDKLLLQMAKHAAAVDDEVSEMLHQIRRKSKRLLKEGPQFTGDLPGGQLHMFASLTGLMGELRKNDLKHRRQMEEMKNKMKKEGKTLMEISNAIQEQYKQIIDGDSSCQGLILQLNSRYHEEREAMLFTMRSKKPQTLMDYTRLLRQILLIEEENSFVAISTAVGLAERAMEPRVERSDWDRSRSERLAQLHIEERVNVKQQRTSRDFPDKAFLNKATPIDLQLGVVKEMTRKHFYEREVLIHLMLKKDGPVMMDKARKLRKEERKNQLQALQNQHQNWRSNPSAEHSILHNILQEGLWLRCEERRLELMETMGHSNITVDEVREVLLADLQQKQGLDFEHILQEMQKMDRQDLVEVLKKECGVRVEEHYNNVAFIVLGTIDISKEDREFFKVLEKKYDILRKQIFLMALKDQPDWEKWSQEERQEKIKDMVKQEKVLRSESKFQVMEKLVGPQAKMTPALRSLIGEDKAENRNRKNLSKNDEDPVDAKNVVNLLADLVTRFDREEAFLTSWIQLPETKTLSLRLKQMRIVEMKVEIFRIKIEEEFQMAALSVGLMERIMDTLFGRHPSDVDRQLALSKKRLQLREKRIRQNEEFHKEPQVSKEQIPKKGDITALQVVYLQEMLKRHSDEREVILTHLQDDSIDDLIEAAKLMSDNERQKRVSELIRKKHNLNLTYEEDQVDNESIIEEAAALKAVSVHQQLINEGDTPDIPAVAVVILSELQEEQDKEVAHALQQIENMNEEDIRTSLNREINNRRLETSWNVMTVLTRYQGEAPNEVLFTALDEKYKVLRLKMLSDSLRIRHGTDKWEELPEEEKRKKLQDLDVQAEEQIKMGRILPGFLGDFVLSESIQEIMGVCPHVFRNKVMGQQSLEVPMNLYMDEDTGVMRKGENVNPLQDIYSRLEEEKFSLARQMKGQTEDFFTEYERQIQLVCRQRECLLAMQEDSFLVAASLMGVMERQQEEIRYRLSNDKDRYAKVAMKWLQRIQKGQVKELPVVYPAGKSLIHHLTVLIGMLENKHIQERELFQRLMSHSGEKEDLKQQAAMCTQQQRLERMTKLKDSRDDTVLVRDCENVEILSTATVFKIECSRCMMSLVNDDITDDDIHVALMADLLEFQNSEAQRVITQLVLKTSEDVKSYHTKLEKDKKASMADNIALVVFFPEKSDGTTDTDLIEALKGKYDALKDKLIAEALMKELGESEWNRLSAKEKQRRIFQLKLKEKQLRKAGKIDEANAILAELLNDQETLRKLMGDSAMIQKQKLEERLRRRKERLAQGMSKEEVEALEREEMEGEENDGGNVLEDLDRRFELERDALLRGLEDADNEYEKEKQRQAHLARLRRDQRMARDEDRFGAAALILGLSEKHDRSVRENREEEKKRQQKLARERLEAARKRRAEGLDNEEDDEDEILVDKEDTVSLQEAIARDMDRKHRHEREMFVELLEDNDDGNYRKAAHYMSADERDDKLFELWEMYKHWSGSPDQDIEELLEIFKEAIGCMAEILKYVAEYEGKTVEDDDLHVILLANLQECQKKEAQHLLNEIEDKELKDLQQLHKAYTMKTNKDYHDNIVTVLLSENSRSSEVKDMEEGEDEGPASTANVLKALEEKYDAMKDKLFIEALMKEYGEREWAQMSEQERQRKLIEMKLKERRLRKEGKLDEIANIIGSHLENEKVLDELMGETKKTQQERVKERLARRKQLIAERKSQGLSTDEETINAIVEEQEEQEKKMRRRNILEDLQKNFDDEKARILKALSQHTDRMTKERERQIALAKLKRDERRLKKTDRLDAVSLIIINSKEEEKKRVESIESERERQRSLAKEKLEARRRKRNQAMMGPEEIEHKLSENEERSKLSDAVQDAEGRSVQEAFISTVESKQEEETDMMMALLDIARGDDYQTEKLKSKPFEELKSELLRLEQDEQRLREKSITTVQGMDEETISPEEAKAHLTVVAQNRSEMLKVLTSATFMRLEIGRRLLKESQPDLEDYKLEEEVFVAVVTDLQEKHESESRTVQKLMENQNDKVIMEMKRNQHIARREGWYDNLTRSLFNIPYSAVTDTDRKKIDAKFEKQLKQIDQDFEKAVEAAINKAVKEAGPDGDVDREAIREKLEKEYEFKKQKLSHDKEEEFKKIEAMQIYKDQKDYEKMVNKSMMERWATVKKAVKQTKMTNKLQELLAERRDARMVARDHKSERRREGSTVSSDRPASMDSSINPFGSMRREKTVIDVDVSEEQKQLMISQIMRQQDLRQSQISEEKRRQAERLRRRLEVARGSIKQEEALEVITLGQRQKTILEKSKMDEKQRQQQKMKEKLSRVRERREPSPGLSTVMDSITETQDDRSSSS